MLNCRAVMKIINVLIAITAFAQIHSIASNSVQDFSPHFPTNAQIIWKAPTNTIPKSFWIYKLLPNTFTAPVISNAIVLASFESKGFPQPSTNEIILVDRTPEGDDPLAGSFAVIIPRAGQISFNKREHQLGSTNDIPSDATVRKKARDCALLLGLNLSELSEGKFEKSHCEYNEKGGMALDEDICGKSFNLIRNIDGLPFMGESEGFSIEIGSRGVIRSFGLNWPKIDHFVNLQTFAPTQIISMFKDHKTILIPDDPANYFQKIKSLSKTEIFSITNIMFYYGEGFFGEIPKENEYYVPKYITPFCRAFASA